jgi:hypothetical protein
MSGLWASLFLICTLKALWEKRQIQPLVSAYPQFLLGNRTGSLQPPKPASRFGLDNPDCHFVEADHARDGFRASESRPDHGLGSAPSVMVTSNEKGCE